MANASVQQIITFMLTTCVGTLIGWLLNSLRTKAEQLRDKTEQEREEREQNRKMLGDLLFYRLTDLHYRYVVQGNPCPAADKQQVDDIYHHYHDELGLNGPGTHMYNEIMKAHQC